MRTRWQRPDAVVVTDSGAVLNLQGPPVNASSTAAAAAMAINNGTDMNDGHGFKALATAIEQGLTTEAKVDVALKRALRQLFTAGLFDQVAAPWTLPQPARRQFEHHPTVLPAAANWLVDCGC